MHCICAEGVCSNFLVPFSFNFKIDQEIAMLYRGGSRRGSLGGGGGTHTGRGGTVMLGLFLVFVKPIF